MDQYGVVADPVPMIDIETANWRTSTYPGSPFVRGPIISATAHDGSRTLMRPDSEHGFVLVEQTPEHRQTTSMDHSAFAAVLHERFGLAERIPIDSPRVGCVPIAVCPGPIMLRPTSRCAACVR